MKQSIKLLSVAMFLVLSGFMSQPAQAQEKFLGDVFLVGFNFCPRASAEAAGQILPINQNQALYSLLGTTYGGDGRTTFALPDLRGRVPISFGTGPGLSTYAQGQQSGLETVTLTAAEMPEHTHTGSIRTAEDGPNSSSPSAAALAESQIFNNTEAPSADAALNAGTLALSSAGSSQAHENRMPVLAMKYCIATQGVFPSRN